MNTEEMMRAANTFDNAAEQMKRNTELFAMTVYKLEQLLGNGYGNNIDRLIEALERLPVTTPVEVCKNFKGDRIRRGKWWISFRYTRGWLMFDIAKRWRFAFVVPDGKPYAKRFYFAFLMIEVVW